MKNLFTGMTKPLIAAALLLAGNAGAVGNFFQVFYHDGTDKAELVSAPALLFFTDGSGDWSRSAAYFPPSYDANYDVSKIDSVTLAFTKVLKMTALDIRDTALRAGSSIPVIASPTPSNSTEWLSWSVGDTTVLKLSGLDYPFAIGVYGLKAGKTKLYVKSSLTGLRDSATVTVGAPLKAATGIRIGALSSNALRAGSARALSVTFTPADAEADTAVEYWFRSDATKGVTVSGDSLRYSGYPNVAVKDSVWVGAATAGGLRDSVKVYLYGIGLRVWDGRTEAADASHLFLRDWDDRTAGTLQGDSVAPEIVLDAGDATNLGDLALDYVYGPTGSTDGRDDATEAGECRSTDTTVMKLATCGDGGLDPARYLFTGKAGSTTLLWTLGGLTIRQKVSVYETPATAVKFGVDTIFTWPGKMFTVPATLSPSGAEMASLRWTVQGASTSDKASYNYTVSGTSYHIFSVVPPSRDLTGRTLVDSRYPAAIGAGVVDTLIAACVNGGRDSVVVASRLAMLGSWNGSDFSEELNQSPTQSNVYWDEARKKLYIRAYYAANTVQFITAINEWLAKIPTSEYTVTSDDDAVTVARAADGVTYELTRTEFSTLKEVTLTYTFGAQTFTEIVTPTK